MFFARKTIYKMSFARKFFCFVCWNDGIYKVFFARKMFFIKCFLLERLFIKCFV